MSGGSFRNTNIQRKSISRGARLMQMIRRGGVARSRRCCPTPLNVTFLQAYFQQRRKCDGVARDNWSGGVEFTLPDATLTDSGSASITIDHTKLPQHRNMCGGSLLTRAPATCRCQFLIKGNNAASYATTQTCPVA